MDHLVIAVVGPTAAGKSDLALDLATRLDAEIVNADAMQLYRGMDIGTAKVPAAERRGITHHQLDVLQVTEEASVAAYQRHGREDLQAIAGRGRAAIVVGGSGLYVRALLDDLNFPGTDPQVRAGLEQRAAVEGTAALYAELAAADPVAADRIEARNTRRIVRALEVISITGRPFSANLPEHRYAVPAIQIGIQVPRSDLHERIETRTRSMFDAGLLAETEELAARGLRGGRTARTAVGYTQALAVLAGTSTLADAITDTATATRRLARRQITWFGKDPRVHWVPAGPDALGAAMYRIEAEATHLPGPGST